MKKMFNWSIRDVCSNMVFDVMDVKDRKLIFLSETWLRVLCECVIRLT